MRYRMLDENGDYMLGHRDLFYVDREAAAQAVKTRLQLLLGEWWENTEDGLPLFQQILNTFHAPDQRAEQIDLLFSERILGTQGITEILSFESNIDMQTRTYSAQCEVQTEYGQSFGLQISGGSSLNITI